jgi:hypothetical protein
LSALQVQATSVYKYDTQLLVQVVLKSQNVNQEAVFSGIEELQLRVISVGFSATSFIEITKYLSKLYAQSNTLKHIF